jgi:hypothetical protein
MAASKQTFAAKDCAAPQPSIPDQEILDQITRSAQYATGASGAALILSDGNIMSCRACSGNLAPPVGTTLNTETGFTAACVRNGTLVRCDDTQTDPRVDGASCKELGIGSILAVPIFNGPGVTGVLEVLSNTPQSFTERHAAGLQLLGRLVETLSNYDSPNNVSFQSAISDVQPREIEAGSATLSDAKIICISCRHGNPQGSQFCNRCGVILFSFLGPEDARVHQSPSAVSDSSNDEDLKEIRNVIAGNGLTATWNEISKRLLADQTVRQPVIAATDPANKTEGVMKDIGVEGSAQEAARLKTGMRTAVRRRLWL